MKHLSLRMLFLLFIILTGSSSIYGQSAVSPEGADAYVYSLVTDASTLAAGDQFVIVYQNETTSAAMAGERDSKNNRAQVDVIITDNTISELPDEAQVVELEKISTKWYLKVGNEYLYAPGKGSNNYLKTTTDGSPNADYGKATIVIGEKNGKSNVATITFSGADNTVIGHYGTLFSCYSPSMSNREIRIYRREPAATFGVTMGSAGWRTLICAQNVSVQDGYQAYTVTGSDASSVMLTNVASVKAGSPYLLSGPEGTCTLTVVDAAEEPEGNLLAVSTESDGDGNDVYVLANKSHGVGFYRWDGGLIGSGRVILPAAAVAGESREFIGFDEGGTTSISEKLTVKSEKFAPATEFFNLNGQRVTAPTKGLYIVNGRKVVVK